MRRFSLLLLLCFGGSAGAVTNGRDVGEGDAAARSTVFLLNTTFRGDEVVEKHVCTGSLIGADLVETAAHCVPQKLSGNRPGETTVILALFRREVNAEDIARGLAEKSFATLAAVAVHPDYAGLNGNGQFDDTKPINDIALLRLPRPAPAPWAPLPLARDPAAPGNGAIVTVAGFGPPEGAARPAEHRLRQGGIPVLDTALPSKQILLGQYFGLDQTKTNPGDSGGPALAEIEGRPALVGNISNGPTMPGLGQMTALEPVARHLDWIKAAGRALGADTSGL